MTTRAPTPPGPTTAGGKTAGRKTAGRKTTGQASTDPSRRADFDVLLDDLVAETASLRRILTGLPDSAWDAPTPAAGWTVRDQIGHLAWFDATALAALEQPEQFAVDAARLVALGDDFADVVAREQPRLAPDDLLTWLDESRAALVRAYRAAEPGGRLPWYGPPMSVMTAATARLMETWAHGVDVADALGVALEDSPRLRHVAHLGVRTMAFSFGHHGLEAPTAPVRVELSSGTSRWAWGPTGAADTVRGTALDFCLVVTQRRHPGDTGLQIDGPVARAWMDAAQAFAGPATRPLPGRGPTDTLGRDLIQRVNVGDLLTRSARRAPAAVAVIDSGRRHSYAELNAWVNRVANGLVARGYRPGDRLGLVSGNRAEFLVVYLACAKTGVVCVPINLGWRPDEVAFVLGHSRARGVVVEAALLAGIAGALDANPGIVHVVSIDAEATVAGRDVESLDRLAAAGTVAEPAVAVGDRDPVSILYTSGTTAAPKGVVASHTAVYVETLSMALEGHFDATDRFVAMLPMFHTAQLNVHCTPAIAVGAAIHVLRSFDPATLLGMIEQEGITQIFGLPMMYRAMLDHPDVATRQLGSLRRATYAMAPMPENDLRRCIETFACDFSLLFGQTEMSPSTCIFRPEHQLSHAGAVGTPVVNVEVAIMDADGALVPQGGQGEIVYRGPHAMTGYLDDPEATAAAFAHGWFHSGDAGAFDADGVLWFRDRFKDVIKTGGENVASLEVETAILTHVPGVAEAAVVGIHHDRWSEAITAFVVPTPGATVGSDDVRRALHGRIDPYKLPKAVVTVEALPRTSTGKVRKSELRRHFGDLYDSEER